jgi:hypothetical protein
LAEFNVIHLSIICRDGMFIADSCIYRWIYRFKR